MIRERWGVKWGYFAVLGLLFANFGTICAEYAGISAAGSLVGIPSWGSAPIAAVLISLVVVLGSFHRVERVLLFISATLGTTLAPWGLAFIQSYAVDKKITVANLRWERVDVVIGSVLTGVIGMAIAIACAATLNRAGVHIETAGDAAEALRPLAGSFATVLFGAGLLGASLLAAAFVGLTIAAASVVALPGLPLIPLIYTSQVVNAVMLPLHVVALQLLARNPAIMGDARSGNGSVAAGWVSIALIIACVGALAWSWVGSLGS